MVWKRLERIWLCGKQENSWNSKGTEKYLEKLESIVFYKKKEISYLYLKQMDFPDPSHLTDQCIWQFWLMGILTTQGQCFSKWPEVQTQTSIFLGAEEFLTVEPYYLNVPPDSYFEYQVSGITFQRKRYPINSSIRIYETLFSKRASVIIFAKLGAHRPFSLFSSQDKKW